MPEFENEQQAAEALFAAIKDDGSLSTNDRIMAEAEASVNAGEEQAEAPAQGSEGTTEVAAETAEDSFTGLDPNAIPDDLKPFYRSMQADYTRTKQSLAEQRKQFEALDEFGGIDTALEAVNFARQLATDPQFALGVHEQLSAALQEAGLTPAQASVEASRQINETAAQSDSFDEFGEVNPELERKLAALEAKTSEIEQWRAEQAEREEQLALANELMRQENKLIQDHPDYTEADLDAVYNLAYATGGNLELANQRYQEMRDQVITHYIEAKGSVTANVPKAVEGTVSSIKPQSFNDLNDPGLEKLVQEYLAQQAALGNL